MLRHKRVSIAVIGAGLVAAGVGFAQESPRNQCRVAPVRTDAMDWPSKHAWQLFVALNHPAIDRKLARGVPDCSKPFGLAGATSVWETWRNAHSEVYLRNGAEPPEWNDTSLPDEAPGKVPQPRTSARGIGPLFSPSDGIFHNAGGFGETRLNRATYEFVRNECLYSVEGQQRYALAVKAGKKTQIRFPVDSMEVKAAWIDFDDPQGNGTVPPIPMENRGTYYTAEFTPEGGSKKMFGLASFHILTKDVPNWFWASFHHKDNLADNVKMTTPDDYGQPKEVVGTVWENYRLGGTQIEFSTATGEASILGDHYIEYGFVRSSCITCHATAAISREIWTSDVGRKFTSMPRAQQKAVCSITPDSGGGFDECSKEEVIGTGAFRPGTKELSIERGVPDPVWFMKDGEQFYLQTDFVWSIPFRGRSEASAPPERCLW